MKFYKSFILFSLLALTFVSCNTDDLERDIDALKDRVANFEAQVQQLNDEMNIIRVLLDGNKTITDYSVNGDTYTLTLSNGETLTLTPGATGGNYPSIEIGENGNWFIGGKDTGLRAKAEDGDDASITPKFKIEANPADGGKKYWWVSYDNGTNWSVLENGLAEGTNSQTNPIKSAIVEGDNFKVTLNDGSEHLIPIIKGLECAINAPASMTNGFWMVAGGAASSFTVKVNLVEGDLVRVNAPTDWNAKVLPYATGAKEVTVTVTPPSTANECVIVVEVTHGVNTATDQIKAKTTINSYWAEYQAGLNINIGDIAINKYDYPNAELLKDGETIAKEGVYFISDNATVSLPNNIKNLILIAENKGMYPKAKTVTATPSMDVSLLCKGIHFLAESAPITRAYWLNLAGTAAMERLYFEECKIEIPDGKNFSYFSNGVGITNIMINSCRISMAGFTGAAKNVMNFLNLYSKAFSNIEIQNNIFHCRTVDTYSNIALMTIGTGSIKGNVVIDNNTFMNMFNQNANYYMTVPLKTGWSMKNNLIWYDNGELGTVKSLIGKLDDGATLDSEKLANNRVFTSLPTTVLDWRLFNSTPGGGFNNSMKVDLATTPFEDGFVATEGKYTIKPEYQGIGATIE